jgi:hypothetical protein
MSQLLVTVARLKAFFGYSKDKQDKLIDFTEVPSGVHSEENYGGIEEVKLDEAWDLTAAEDAPTECLVDHEEENDGVMSRQILVDRKVTMAPLHSSLPGG